MNTTKKLTSVATTAAVAALLLAAPTAAQAAETCESGMLVAPTLAAGVGIFDEPTNETMTTATSTGRLTAPECAATGIVIEADQPELYAGSVELVAKDGKQRFVRELESVVYPEVKASELTEYAVMSESHAVGLWGKAAEVKPGLFAAPDASLNGSEPVQPLEPGDVVKTNPEISTQGTSKLGNVPWQPALDQFGSVGWTPTELLAPLPAADAPLATFEIPDEGYTVYDNPTDKAPVKALDAGTTIKASAPAGGWMRASDGWVKMPAKAGLLDEEDGKADGSGTWDKVKNGAKDLANSAGDKASAAADKIKGKAEAAAENSKTLTFPAMVISMILAAVAVVTGFLGMLVRRAKGGWRALTPKELKRRIIGLAAAPVSLAASLASIAIAPSAWGFAPWVAAASGLVAAGTVLGAAFRLRGGAVSDREGVRRGMRGVVPIALGAGVLVVTGGALVLLGVGAWPAYVVAAIAGAAAWIGAALATPVPEIEEAVEAAPEPVEDEADETAGTESAPTD